VKTRAERAALTLAAIAHQSVEPFADTRAVYLDLDAATRAMRRAWWP